MQIELTRHPSGGFQVTAVADKTTRVLGNIAYDSLEEARRFADFQAEYRGWPLINKVEDDLPTAHRRGT